MTDDAMVDTHKTAVNKYIIQSFANKTTLQGVPRVILSRSKRTKVFWLLVCLVAGTMFCVEVSQLFKRYFSYPKKVNVEVVSSQVPFPYITLCNMRNLDFSILNEVNSLFLEDKDVTTLVNRPYESPFVTEYINYVAKYVRMLYDLQDKYTLELWEAHSRTSIFSNINKDSISNASIQLNEFVAKCYFGGHKCDMSEEFTKFLHPYYYNCFTYRSPDNDKFHGFSDGLENGWSVLVLTGSGMLDRNIVPGIIPGVHELAGVASGSDGVRVVIHPPDTHPFPLTEGYDVPPGFAASLGIRQRHNIRIGQPHGTCINTNPYDTTNDTSRRYRRISCQQMCLQSHVMSECGCYDETLVRIASRNEKPCRHNEELLDTCKFSTNDICIAALLSQYKRVQCSRRIKAFVRSNQTMISNCGCHPPCDEYVYDVEYSLSKWPAPSYEGDGAFIDVVFIEQFLADYLERNTTSKKGETLRRHFSPSNREIAMKDFARINVYLTDTDVVLTKESPEYEHSQLVSDIGGQLGVWIGISIITIMEVLELLWMLITHCIAVRWPQFQGIAAGE